MVFALGAGGDLVGVTTYDKFPPEARLKPKVGGFINPNYEVIITMRPTLVLMLPIHRELMDKFSMLGIKTVVVNDNRVEDILASILKIGEITGRESEARLLVSRLRREESAVMSRHGSEKRPRVMVVVSRQKGTLKSVFVAGGNTLFDDLVRKAGGENVFADSKASYPMVSPEQIVHKNPDVIIQIEMGKSASRGEQTAMLKDWEALSIVSAVRNGRDYQINEDYASVPGPRYILLLKKFAELINSARTVR
jgi:iron complex transport system substrate-binding protein